MKRKRVVIVLLIALLTLSAVKIYVKQVFDGDTLALSTGEQVRYLGVDSPEIDHQGGKSDFLAHEARELNAKLVQGKSVRLEYDAERKDHHGRLLAYVYLENGDMVNELLVRKGLARVLARPPNLKHFSLLLDSQRRAMVERVGIWQKDPDRPEPFYIGNSSSFRFHRPGCNFGKSVSGRHRVRFESAYKASWEGYSPCRQCKP
ncbi:MAG: thermonuclease family protein [Deltaproteobacteria bacterium]